MNFFQYLLANKIFTGNMDIWLESLNIHDEKQVVTLLKDLC